MTKRPDQSRKQQEAFRFADWRARNRLSLSGAAAALGISRRQVAYYDSGEKPVPTAITLACKAIEANL